MFGKKTKKIFAMLCIAIMLFATLGENAMVVMAAGEANQGYVLDSEDQVVDESEEPVESLDSEVEVVEVPSEEVATQMPVEETGSEVSTEEAVSETPVEDEEVREDVALTTSDYVLENGVLTIKANVTAILAEDELKDLAFTELRFESGSKLTYIGVRAFEYNESVEKIDFSNCSQLTDIKKFAFYGCTSLEEVIFSESLQKIEESAFQGCISITEITLTEGLISIGSAAFADSLSLSTVVIEANNIVCLNSTGIFKGCKISNIVFSKNTVVPSGLFCRATFSGGFELIIPSYIQEIGENAFKGSNLKNLRFENTTAKPSALASIGKQAFADCSELQNFTLPLSLKMIEEKAFMNCTSITKVQIPNSVTRLWNSAFAGCKELIDISLSNAIIEVGGNVFEDCIALESIEIPSGSFAVGNGMFKDCISLSDVKIADTVTIVGNYAFQNCIVLEKITIPDSVTELGIGAFRGCVMLDNPVLSKYITSLNAEVFMDCINLTTISFSNVQSGKTSELVIPSFISFIGKQAFYGCESIKNLTLGEGIITIGANAFKTCSSVVTLKILSNNISDCGEGIFEECYLNNVVFPAGMQVIPDKLFSKAHFASSASITIPATVTEIGDNAFAGSKTVPTNITSVKFESGSQLESIGKNAFTYCTAIVDIKIPDTVVDIGASAFSYCVNLKEIIIPENVSKIGSSAFLGCEVLTTIKYNAIAVTSSSKDIFKNCNIHTILIGNKVTMIPAYLFYGAKFSINQTTQEAVPVEIYLPVSLSRIGEYSFANIVNLSAVHFGEGCVLSVIGTSAFSECTGLKTITLPDTVSEIGNYAFAGCESLTSFELPQGLVTLGSSAFKGCNNISSYVIPQGVTCIKDHCFDENTSLKSIEFEGENVTSIDDYAFNNCYALESIEIPSGVETIGKYAFNGCSGLKKVKIPFSVSSIGDYAFKGCINAKFYVVKDSYAATWLAANGFANQCETINSITYVLDGGKNDIRNILGYEEGDEFTFYPATKEGYSFDGWYLEPEFETQVFDLTGRTGDFTLYAKWNQGKYTITYELNGGENHPDNPTEYSIEDEFEFKNPTREGYTFGGWYKDPSLSKGKITNIAKGSTGDLTIYAKWTAKRITVKFDGNGEGAKVSKSSMTVVYGETYGTNLPTATREGFEFLGWITEGGVQITSDSVVIIPENHTLYARWKSSIATDAPTADIISGTEVFAGTKVMLKTSTPGAQIHYTVDGSKPTFKSALYVDGIVINKNVTIKAIAVKDGYNDSPVAEFKYTVVNEATYWGDILPEDRAIYSDATKVPNKIWVAGVKDVTYNGSAVTFDLRVYDYKTLLTEKTDYTIKYSNNKNAADVNAKKAPSITITAKGNYKGKVVVKFNILPINIESDDFIIDDVYAIANGKIQKPVPTVYYEGKKLKNKKDFKVSYPDSSIGGYVEGGSYRIQVDGAGNYAGTKIVQFVLQEKTLISKASVSVVKSVNYTGTAQKPAVVVKMGKTVLTEGTDYKLEYQNNTAVGTAYAVIKGMNSYTGVKRVSFTIKPIALMKKTQIMFNKTSVPYTGKAIELGKGTDAIDATVFFNGTQLVLGRDYEILSYAKNKEAGTASVVFSGLGGYSGTVKKSFKIVAANMTAAKVNLFDENGKLVSADTPFAFVKGGTRPEMLITYLGQDLKSGKDYTVSYKNNKKVGLASMTIKGKKNFKGSVTVTYSIKAQELSKMNAFLQDVVYQKASEIYMIKPVLKDFDGKALKAGTDYNATFKYEYATNCYVTNKGKKTYRKAGEKIQNGDILPVETVIKITISGKGNYVGEYVGQYRITKASIAKAKVTVKQQFFTGSEVKPGKEDIVVKVGTTVLSTNDYEIVSYTNNVNKGTGTVTLRGTGNYGGTITVKFKIVQKNFFMWLKKKEY